MNSSFNMHSTNTLIQQAPHRCKASVPSAVPPVKLSSSLRSLLEFLLSPKELRSAERSVRRSQRGDSGKTPGMLQEERRLKR